MKGAAGMMDQFKIVVQAAELLAYLFFAVIATLWVAQFLPPELASAIKSLFEMAARS